MVHKKCDRPTLDGGVAFRTTFTCTLVDYVKEFQKFDGLVDLAHGVIGFTSVQTCVCGYVG